MRDSGTRDSAIAICHIPIVQNMNSALPCFVSIMVSASGALASESDVKVGAAKVDITPDGSVFIGGYGMNRLSTGVHDPVWARCMVIECEGRRIAFLSLDLVGLFLDEVDIIRKGAASDTLSEEDIIVCCTHNHQGPDTLGLWGPELGVSGVDSQYKLELRQRAVECIRKAESDMTPARLRVGTTTVEGVAKNARDRDILDPVLVAIKAEDEKGMTISTIVNFANHPEALGSRNTLISADWPSYLYRTVEEELGGICVLLNGALGGMVTPDVARNTFEETQRIGETTGNKAIECLESAEVLDFSGITHLSTSVRIPLANEGFVELRKAGVIRRSFHGGKVQTELHVIRLGEVDMATIPGEALPKVGLEIKGHMRGKYKILIGLGNDELGYIIPKEDFDASKYEESMSVGPKAAPIIIKGLADLLEGRGKSRGNPITILVAALLLASGALFCSIRLRKRKSRDPDGRTRRGRILP